MLELDEALREFNSISDFTSFQKSISKFSRPDFKLSSDRSFLRQKVAILSNYSTQFLAAALKPSLLARGISPEIFEDEYNQWELSPLRDGAPLFEFRPDVILLLLSSIPLAFGRDPDPISIGKRMVECVLALQKRSQAKILLSLPEPLEEEKNMLTWAHEWRVKLHSYLHENLPSDCFCFSLDALIRRVGTSAWYSPRYYVMSKFPYHPQNTKSVSDALADILSDLAAPRTKLVITDLDNTLWGGVVGEVGAAHVNLNFEEKGYAHLRLQKFLEYLNSRGVLLAIVSKNNFEDAMDVFRSRPEMILKADQFASIKINWKPKSENIREILAELKLSTAGVVFLDDMPFEREEVRHSIPGLQVPELEKDPVLWSSQLLDLGIFYRHLLTREDRDRVHLYKIEKTREEEKVRFSDERAFLSSLHLKLTSRPFSGNGQRVIDLLSKTNQFNLTTRRHNRETLEKMISEGAKIFVFELEDKFGSYGVISVVIVCPVEPRTSQSSNSFHIDTWLMSCRVIGRKVENATLSFLLDELQGASCLTGEFIASDKNRMVENLYPSLGFSTVDHHANSLVKSYRLDLPLGDSAGLEHFCRIERSPL